MRGLKNTLLLNRPEIELISDKYILKKKKLEKKFTVPAILIKYVNNNIISLKIKIDFDKEIKYKK